MQRILFAIIYGITYVFSLLPLSVLYRFGSLAAWLMFRLFQYRKQVIQDNLQQCFPQWSPEALHAIEKQFHRHFADVFMESLKALSISSRQARKRIEVEGQELFDKYRDRDESIILAFGHYANWEWTSFLTYFYSPFQNQAVYKPQKNSLFDRLLFLSRNRYNVSMIPANQVARHFLSKKPHPTLTLYLADQWPVNREKAQWIEFLGRSTAFTPAIERISKKTGCPVLFARVQKLERGKYRYIISELRSSESSTLTEQYAKALEKEILEEPALWLWSHRRWKDRNKNK